MKTAKEQAAERMKQVEAAFVRAEGAWESVGVSIGSLVGITPKNTVLGAIRQMRTLGYVRWATRAATLTDKDDKGWATWVRDGNDMLKNLAEIAQDADVSSIDGIVMATVAQSAQDVKETAKAVWDFKWPIVAAVMALAAMVWRLKK